MEDRLILFSKNQQKVLEWWKEDSPYKDFDAIVCDGSIRSGKTVSMALSFVMWGNSTFNKKNLAFCGKTIDSLVKNVVSPLMPLLKRRGLTVQYRRADKLLIIGSRDTTGKKVSNNYYLYGGKDESSKELIQGITLAGIFFDEVALMPQSFVNQATARCSVTGSKYWFNCNPEGPKHYFKTEWIDNIQGNNLVYNLHFTMNDNLSLTERKKAQYRSQYTGIFYKRYILGLWVMAEGLIFDMFDEERNVKKDPFTKYEAERLFISIDYGTQNPCTFGKYGVKKGHYHLFEHYYYSGREKQKQKTDREYVDDLITFIGDDSIKYICIDPSASSLIAEIRDRLFFRQRGIRIIPAKNAVIKGIQDVGIRLQEGKFTIDPDCTEDIKEMGLYQWDEKASNRGEDIPLKENDHCMDRNRYAIRTDLIVFANKGENLSGRGAMNNKLIKSIN